MSELKPCEAIEILESIYPSKKQIVTGEYPDVAEALDMAIVTLRRTQPTNEPLTLEQLRKMGGEPAWIELQGGIKYGRWAIVAGTDDTDGEKTLYCDGDFTCRNYGKTWLAYRRKPEGSENHGRL